MDTWLEKKPCSMMITSPILDNFSIGTRMHRMEICMWAFSLNFYRTVFHMAWYVYPSDYPLMSLFSSSNARDLLCGVLEAFNHYFSMTIEFPLTSIVSSLTDIVGEGGGARQRRPQMSSKSESPFKPNNESKIATILGAFRLIFCFCIVFN